MSDTTGPGLGRIADKRSRLDKPAALTVIFDGQRGHWRHALRWVVA